MAVTEAQKRATAKYRKTLTSISIRIKPDQAQRYKDAAESAGMSLRAYILEALEEKIHRDSQDNIPGGGITESTPGGR